MDVASHMTIFNQSESFITSVNIAYSGPVTDKFEWKRYVLNYIWLKNPKTFFICRDNPSQLETNFNIIWLEVVF